jgi:hypothetical protein
MKKSLKAARPCAFLWDESFLWGMMAFNALSDAGLPFDLIRSEDIRKGILRNYAMLFVPGGWASNKIKSLGEDGVREIREFVEKGGNYLGFCGGAGLATLDGIGLLNIRRILTRDRVPSFSGGVQLRLNRHPLWEGMAPATPSVFHVWWPSQFSTSDQDINVLATYEEALADSFSSDLNVGDVSKILGDWASLERTYGINLDPSRLHDQPAVMEGRCGQGKVLLSLVHFDTPNDVHGAAILKNLWQYLAGTSTPRESRSSPRPGFCTTKVVALDSMVNAVQDLISFGERNFLWFWRNPMLLQWRRGIRGLEYCTLYGMIKAIADHADRFPFNDTSSFDRLQEVAQMVSSFQEKAERVLLLERQALQDGHRITYDKSDNPEIVQLRAELFSTSKSYGGMFKKLLDKIDTIVFDLLRQHTAKQ